MARVPLYFDDDDNSDDDDDDNDDNSDIWYWGRPYVLMGATLSVWNGQYKMIPVYLSVEIQNSKYKIQNDTNLTLFDSTKYKMIPIIINLGISQVEIFHRPFHLRGISIYDPWRKFLAGINDDWHEGWTDGQLGLISNPFYGRGQGRWGDKF